MVSGQAPVFGSASVPDFASYQIEYGISHDPGAFSLPIYGPVNTPVINGQLGWWDVSGLENGPHTLRSCSCTIHTGRPTKPACVFRGKSNTNRRAVANANLDARTNSRHGNMDAGTDPADRDLHPGANVDAGADSAHRNLHPRADVDTGANPTDRNLHAGAAACGAARGSGTVSGAKGEWGRDVLGEGSRRTLPPQDIKPLTLHPSITPAARLPDSTRGPASRAGANDRCCRQSE